MILALVYPHQLYADQPAVRGADEVWLVEDPLFFSQYRFHRQKLILHRATMQEFAACLSERGIRTKTIEAASLDHTGDVAQMAVQRGATEVRVTEPHDDWLKARLTTACHQAKLPLEVLPDPHFVTDLTWAEPWMRGRKRYFFTEFYVRQRKAMGILLEPDGKPVGGQWSFDTDNRRRLPKSKAVPYVAQPSKRDSVSEAEAYVQQHFPNALGDPTAPFPYPVTPADSEDWLHDFLDNRLYDFGLYEDAISVEETTLFHSVLTPMLNIGLLTPAQVVEAALRRRDQDPLNSLEGFVRQVIGWREFVRLVYTHLGPRQRTTNALGHQNPIPSSLYDGTTGIPPVDTVIRRTLKSGYCHHIERLMILGNFMALIEVEPDAVYQWFMELFIDSYDWVMVPNVYGMSQYADGGLMTTKPYVSGSNYILKMGDFPRGPWCEIWDALYWRFVDKHRDLFLRNPRLSLAVRTLDKMDDRKPQLLRVANDFLRELHGQ